MVDTKISALSALTGANLASGDLLAAVDVSDTTMAASGTDKKMTAAELATGLAPLMAGKVGGPPLIVRKTSDESVTSSTTTQDDNELLFAIAASEVWRFELDVFYTAATAGDLDANVNAPSGASIIVGQLVLADTATGGAGNIKAQATTTVGGGIGTAGGAGSQLLVAKYLGVVTNGATPGNVTFRWAQGNSSGTATIVKAGSVVIAHRLA